MGEQAHKGRLTLWVIIALALVLPAAAYMLLPPSANTTLTENEWRALSSSVTLLTWLNIGSAILFYEGLNAFKEHLRRAYRAICLGLLSIGVALLQFPFVTTYELWESPWMVYGLYLIPSFVAICLFFYGLRLFAKGLNENGWWMSLAVIPSALVIGGLSGVLLSEPFDYALAWQVAIVVLDVFVLLIAWRIRQSTGPAYTAAMTWFFLAIASSFIGAVGLVIITMMKVEDSSISILPSALAGILFVKAGYSFIKIGAKQQVVVTEVASAVDVVLYVVSLVSNPKAVDPLLDPLRLVTSRIQQGQKLSEEDQKTLANVCHRLETYLTEEEPLRVFDRQMLHTNIQEKFPHRDPTQLVFWNTLTRLYA